MKSPIIISFKPAAELSPTEIADCYALIARTGFPFPPGYLESAHLVHNPTMVLAHLDGVLVGIQSYSLYKIKTPFRRRNIPFLYGGIGFQDMTAAGQGIAHHMSARYMRFALGPFWMIRSYVFLFRTPNPKLIQLMGLQHRLYLPNNNRLTQPLVQFAQDFVRKERSIQYPIDDRLVVLPPDEERTQTDITEQWPLLYRSSKTSYNQLAFDLNLIGQANGRRYLMGNYLLVLGQSSRIQLLKAAWKLGRRWVKKQLGSPARKPKLVLSEPI
ncbi:hypothetical protein IC229_30815 [Spirosoma sp. BT702]|uniref:Uncharacterized protein n=1 Tax=Spirosoma profusum TaxID=2771354 RepID=A0A927AV93_9BACT|nr:hypothetical protein [Spirosoma profusum]MBD2705058.1 hypothetical protein [Spirosoma profusum]